MVYFPSLLLPSIAQISATTAASLTASVVSDFFMNIFLHPGDNVIGVIVFGAVAVGVCVGLAFLAKMVYEKYCPERK